MHKNDKNSRGLWTSLNLGIVISICTTLLFYMVSFNNALTKFIVSILVGASVGFLVSMVIYLNRKLKESTIHDELTGLYNANFLNECKFRVMAQTDRNQGKMGLVLADIHQMNDIVGQYGNKVEEEILMYVGEGLDNSSRASEFIFRLESNKFMIFFTDINEYSNIKIIKSRLKVYFQKPLMYHEVAIDIKLNFGYAVYPEDGSSFEEVFNVAQQRMYMEQSR